MPFVQVISEASTATAHTMTFASNPVNGNCVVVGVRTSGTGSNFTSIADNKGNSYTGALETGATNFSNGTRRIYGFIAQNITGGASFTVTYTTNVSTSIRWFMAEYDSVPTSGVIEDVVTAAFTTATSITSGAVTSTVASDMIVGWIVLDAAPSSITAGGSSTERTEVAAFIQLQDQTAGAAGSYTSAWTLGSTQPGSYCVWALKSAVAAVPVITSVDSDNVILAGQANATIDGSGFGGDGASAKIELIDGAITSLCTKVSWTDTHIVFNVVQGNVRYGSGRTIKITTNTLQTDTHTVTLNVASGSTQYTNMAALKALTWDANGTPSRLTPKGSAADGTADMTGAVQVEMTRTAGTGAFTVDADGRFQWAQTMTHGQWRWHSGTSWSSLIEWDLRGLFSLFVGPAIADQTYTQNAAITPLNHSQRYSDPNTTDLGGTYALQGGPVTGLVWNATSGQETGTPTVPGDVSGLSLRFTNVEGSFTDSNSFHRITEATPNPPFFTGTIGPNFQALMNATFPTIACGTNFTFTTGFSLQGNPLPPGLALNATNGNITGTGTAAGIYIGIIIRGTGVGTPADSNAFQIEIVDPGLVVVPNVIGLLESIGQGVIEASGLIMRSGYGIGLPAFAGQIIDQSPLNPTTVTAGSTVTVFVSKANVPNLYALTPAEATTRCTPLGYTLGTVTPENSQTLPGRIIRQDPVMGVSSDPRTTINVVIGQEMNLGARTKRRWE